MQKPGMTGPESGASGDVMFSFSFPKVRPQNTASSLTYVRRTYTETTTGRGRLGLSALHHQEGLVPVVTAESIGFGIGLEDAAPCPQASKHDVACPMRLPLRPARRMRGRPNGPHEISSGG